MSDDSWITAKLVGFEEVEQALNALPEKLAKKALREITAAGARIIKAETIKNAPVDKGDLKKSIKMSYKFIPARGEILYKIYPGKEYARLGHLIEFGSAPHIIRSRRPMGYKGRYGTVVHHPGTKPQPFMRTAFDENTDKALRAMARQAKRSIYRIRFKQTPRLT